MTDRKKIIGEIKELGYAVIPNVLTAQECTLLKKHCQQVHEKFSDKIASSSNAQKFHGERAVKMIYNLHNKHEDFLYLINHPVTFPIVQALLQEGSYDNKEEVILKLSSARSPEDGAPAQQLHIDSSIPGLEVPLVMQVVLALDSFDPDNGSTRFVPGSHKNRSFAENGKTYSNEVSVDAPAGSAIIYNGGLWHGSGEKRRPGDRWGIILTYTRWFMKTSFDHFRNTPRSVFEKMSDEQKEIMGFRFQPPQDEFERVSRRSTSFSQPFPYDLPH